MSSNEQIQIGWEEWISLPELNLPLIRAKVDTGAKTSALHAFMVEKLQEGGVQKIRFGIHPIPDRPDIEIYCKANLVSEREITSSNGQTELRYVIKTLAQFGKRQWPIEITLTDRETMAYRMLLGRSAMKGKLLVIPEKSFLLGKHNLDVYQRFSKRPSKRKLSIAILSRAHLSYATERLSALAQSKGHRVEIINTSRCYVDISSKQPAIYHQGKKLDKYDAIIPRIGESITSHGVAVLRQFESLGNYCLNSATAISHSRDKLVAHQLLSRAGVQLPTTAFAHYPDDINDLIKIIGGAPLVIKLIPVGSKKRIVVAPTNQAAITVMKAFRGLEVDFLAQEYIKPEKTKNIVCIVLGSKVIASVSEKRAPQEHERLKANHRYLPIELTDKEKKLAIRVARVMGLKFAAVNFFRARQSSIVIDVNSMPLFKPIERATGIDIAAQIIQYIETHARPRLVKRVLSS